VKSPPKICLVGGGRGKNGKIYKGRYNSVTVPAREEAIGVRKKFLESSQQVFGGWGLDRQV